MQKERVCRKKCLCREERAYRLRKQTDSVMITNAGIDGIIRRSLRCGIRQRATVQIY
jgi:hypothetical protein